MKYIVGEFGKVSLDQFKKDIKKLFPLNSDDYIEKMYNEIKLPKRSTSESAGYDFVSPCSIELNPGDTILIPTAINVKIVKGWVLLIAPRSSLGFKYRLQLDNTIGVIDGDYINSDNEGHIMLKITNDSKDKTKTITINAGDRIAQGIFTIYGITYDDDVNNERNGGFGSTGV